MKHLSGVLILLLFTFDCICSSSTSNETKLNIEITDPVSNSENLTFVIDSVPRSARKRSAEEVVTDLESCTTVFGCLKGTRNRPKTHVTFEQSIMDATTFDISEEDPSVEEKKYITALYNGKLALANNLRKQGLVLSDSNTVFSGVNGCLKTSFLAKNLIEHLFKNQPQVFTQKYACSHNVFHGATQINLDYIIDTHPRAHGVIVNIFKEAIRNRGLKLKAAFYERTRTNRIWEMINLAEEGGRADLAFYCYTIPRTLDGYNENGETFFTEAVKNMDTARMNNLVQRRDAANFMLSKNTEDVNAIDAAVDLHDQGLDPEYFILRELFQVIPNSFRNCSLMTDIEGVLINFVDHCREADDNEIIVLALEEILKASIEYAQLNPIDGFSNEFIKLVDKHLDSIYSRNLISVGL